MKVLHVIPGIAPRYGGPSRAVLGMVRALNDNGIDAMIATTDADGPRRLPVGIGKVADFEGAPVIFFSRILSEALKISPQLSRWLIRNVNQFDIVHIHAIFNHSSMAAARACYRAGIPYIIRPLGTLDPWSLEQKSFRKNISFRFGVRGMLNRASATHYTTKAEHRLACLSGLPLAPAKVIPLGVDENPKDLPTAQSPFRRRFPELDGHPYVLVLCRIHPKKALGVLINAFSEFVSSHGTSDVVLVIAGDGDGAYLRHLREMARTNSVAGRVIFTGWLEGDTRAAALSEASLLAQPSHQENFGLSIVEAMARRVPVLVTEEVNLADDIEAAEAGWVTQLDTGKIRDSLAEIFANETERKRRGDNAAHLFATKFTWAVVTDMLERTYQDIIENHPLPADP